MKAYELLARFEAWTQYAYARKGGHSDDACKFIDQGAEFGILSPKYGQEQELMKEGDCWCPDGALHYCYGGAASAEYHEARARLYATLLTHEITNSIWHWNDSLPHTPKGHAQVIAMLKEADV